MTITDLITSKEKADTSSNVKYIHIPPMQWWRQTLMLVTNAEDYKRDNAYGQLPGYLSIIIQLLLLRGKESASLVTKLGGLERILITSNLYKEQRHCTSINSVKPITQYVSSILTKYLVNLHKSIKCFIRLLLVFVWTGLWYRNSYTT